MKYLVKKNNILMLSLFLLLSATNQVNANDIGIEVGSMGGKVIFSHPINDNLTINPSISYLQFKTSKDIGTVNYDVNFKMPQLGVTANYYPIEDSNHYISAGLFYNGLEVKGDGNKQIKNKQFKYITKSHTDTVDFKTDLKVSYNKVAPYIGFGYKSRDEHDGWKFGYNVGVMYQGKAKISHGDFCAEELGRCYTLNEARENPIMTSGIEKYEEELSKATKHKFIPVVGLSVYKNF